MHSLTCSTVSLPSHLPRPRLRGLYVITDEKMGGGHLAIARAALDGGAAILQLRDKGSSLSRLLETARELRRLTRATRALFIINDRVDVALAANADGVHLGPDDLPVAVARRLLGPHRLVGASCGDVAEAQKAERAGADYIGAGAIFGTNTKHDAGAAIGLATLRAITMATSLPVAAIGGVNRDNIAATIAAGASLACVVSAVAGAGDAAAMSGATRALVRVITAAPGSGL